MKKQQEKFVTKMTITPEIRYFNGKRDEDDVNGQIASCRKVHSSLHPAGATEDDAIIIG